MKKLLAMLLGVLMMFTLFTGCSRNDQNSTSGEDVGSLDGVTYDERANEMYVDTKDGKTRIKISYTPGYGSAWILQSARAFLLSDVDNYGDLYYFEFDMDSELTTSVSTKLESGVGLSDIYFPLASNWYSYASLGYLENLDSLYEMTIPGETGTVLDKISGSWETYGQTVRQGETHYYIFPGNENITGIVYNKTLFDQYGWEIPATTAELAALCAEIVEDTNGSIAPFVYPGTVSGGYWDFIGTNWWLQVSGADKLDEFMQFGSPEVFNYADQDDPSYGKLRMLETFEDIIVKNRTTYTLRGSASKDHLAAQISFVQREAAMIPNGNWIEKESLSSMQDEVRMMATPRMEGAQQDADGNYISYNYSGQPDYMFIPAQAANKEGAKLFLAYMCRDDMLKLYTDYSGAPRPFDYDVSECEVSDFIQSCLDVWSVSETWFENSQSELWTANRIKKFNLGNPYTMLLANSDTMSAIGWCASEYTNVLNSWDSL